MSRFVLVCDQNFTVFVNSQRYELRHWLKGKVKQRNLPRNGQKRVILPFYFWCNTRPCTVTCGLVGVFPASALLKTKECLQDKGCMLWNNYRIHANHGLSPTLCIVLFTWINVHFPGFDLDMRENYKVGYKASEITEKTEQPKSCEHLNKALGLSLSHGGNSK